jgi:hypothetical protein
MEFPTWKRSFQNDPLLFINQEWNYPCIVIDFHYEIHLIVSCWIFKDIYAKSNIKDLDHEKHKTLIRTQGIGDFCQIYALSKHDGNDFNLTYIPAEFTEKPREEFDPVYLGKLYELGYRMASKG